MKKLLLIFLLLAGTAVCQAQPRIAVLEFKAGVGLSQSDVNGLAGIFSTYLIDTRQFQVVERVQVDRIVSEQNLQLSSLTESQTVEIGRLLNVRYVVVGDVNLVMGQYTIAVRLLDAQTATGIASAAGQWKSGDTYLNIMKNLVDELVGKISAEPMTAQGQDVSSPVITLLGYLHVYPEDLGVLTYKEAVDLCEKINATQPYGHNDWRLPTLQELKIMLQNKTKLGITKGYYLSNEFAEEGINGNDYYKGESFSDTGYYMDRQMSGQIRLVTTGEKTTAQNRQLPADVYIDFNVVQKMLESLPEYPSAKAAIESLEKSLEDEMNEMTALFNQKIEEYQKNAAGMPPNEKITREKELSDIKDRTDKFVEQAQKMVTAKNTELTTPLVEKVRKSLKEMMAGGNCAYVDVNSLSGAFENLPEYAQVQAELKSLAEAMEKSFKDENAIYEQKVAEYQKNAGSMSSSEKNSMEKEIQDKADRLLKIQEYLRQSLNTRQSELMAPLQAKIRTAIKNVAAKNGFRRIFDSDQLDQTDMKNMPEVSVLVRKELGLE